MKIRWPRKKEEGRRKSEKRTRETFQREVKSGKILMLALEETNDEEHVRGSEENDLVVTSRAVECMVLDRPNEVQDGFQHVIDG